MIFIENEKYFPKLNKYNIKYADTTILYTRKQKEGKRKWIRYGELKTAGVYVNNKWHNVKWMILD